MIPPDAYIDHPRQVSHTLDDWPAIIRREWLHCNDAEYAQHLGRLYFAVAKLPLGKQEQPTERRQTRPLAGQVEAALHRASQANWSGGPAWAARLKRLQQAKAKEQPLEEIMAELNHPYWVTRLLARHVLPYRGGEAVEALLALAKQSSETLQAIALWLGDSIAADTVSRLADSAEQWLCLKCFIRCQAHHQRPSLLTRLTYYGCRVCRRSWGLIHCPQGVTAVLDSTWAAEYELAEGRLQVNWLARKTLFDFDRVVIRAASDQAVEQFAMRAGNDGDPIRRGRYSELDCTVSPDCDLSPNTWQVLRHIFGRVAVSDSQL